MSQDVFMMYARRLLAVGCALLPTSAAWADKFDVVAPPGSVTFGSTVTALSNGNFVVTDPYATNGSATNAGAVALYDSAGNLISTLRGRAAGDEIGLDGVVEVGGSNFVVVSSIFKGDPGQPNGAVTWCNGATGLSGVVSSSNSLVGGQYDSKLGAPTITVLLNGNYVVATPGWNNWLGAATWGSSAGGPIGNISAANSLVGSDQHSNVAYPGILARTPGTGVIALANGNYVVTSANLATWGDGSVGLKGVLSESNSLLSTSGVTVLALSNGNYVVSDINWNGVGAAVWGNGSSGTIGIVSAGNALTGTMQSDAVGALLALSNGNYVVGSPIWHGFRGAVTWGNGATGTVGVVSTSNSLVGSSANDYVGQPLVPLCNGNYVVGSPNWNGGYGAATWRSGSSPEGTAVSVNNSLVGGSASADLGLSIAALANCNYVVGSDGVENRGYLTWASGSAGLTGVVSSNISLVGAAPNDLAGAVFPLSNGNYVVASSYGGLGAFTWVDGSKRFVGTVSSGNSLVGTASGDYAGSIVTALPNGNYLVGIPSLNNNTGAVTWGNGAIGTIGGVSIANSLFGLAVGYKLGSYGIRAFDDNNYAIDSPNWDGGRAAITLGNGDYRQTGIVEASATAAGSNTATWALPFAYDKQHHQLIVGRPADNVVTIVRMDEVFSADFD
jgi:hypothetical protein